MSEIIKVDSSSAALHFAIEALTLDPGVTHKESSMASQ